MPSTIAMRKCAELVFVPPRFDVYREVSKQIHAIFKEYTPLVEPLSLDEAYLDVTDNLKGIPTAWETAKEIRARIYEETRLTSLGRNFLQQVPRQARIGLSQTKRSVRDHARRRRSFRSDPTGSEVPWRGSKDGRQDARPRH